jgi:peptidoglycan/LPS O-acetylase OafA/YrhL
LTWPVLEAWRGFAALLVVLAHYGPSLGLNGPVTALAFTGVDIFFVISGFVFGPLLMSRGSPNWLPFALRRATRILPAYWLALLCYVILYWSSHQSTGPWALHLLFLHLQSRETAFALNPAFWSLVPEVQFYLFIPVLVWVLNGSEKRLWGLVFASISLRLWLAAIADREGADTAFLMLHQLPGMLIEFLIGTMAWVYARSSPQSPLLALTAGLAGLMGWLLLAQWFHAEGNAIERHIWVGGASLLASAFAAAMVLGSLQLRLAPICCTVARWLGGISYPLYLFHMAPLMALQGHPALALGIGLALAVSVHIWFEEPIRIWGRRQSDRLVGRSKNIC